MSFFFHPDYTVGFGIPAAARTARSPDQPLSRVADFTASEELHLALKNFSYEVLYHNWKHYASIFYIDS